MLQFNTGVKTFLKSAVKKILGTRENQFKILYEGKSEFRKISIVEDKATQKIMMFAGNKLFVAGIDKKTGFPINASYFLTDLLVKNPKNILFIGGGPQAVPSYVWRKYKPDHVDVIERDVLTTELAKKYFRMPISSRYKVHSLDVNEYLAKTKRKYDIIYSNIGLTRKRGISNKDLGEFCSFGGIKLLSKMLTGKGVLIFIVIAKLENEDLDFLRAVHKRLVKSFTSVAVFSDDQEKLKKTQTVIFLASKSRFTIKKVYTKFLQRENIPHEKFVYEELMDKLHRKRIL